MKSEAPISDGYFWWRAAPCASWQVVQVMTGYGVLIDGKRPGSPIRFVMWMGLAERVPLASLASEHPGHEWGMEIREWSLVLKRRTAREGRA